MSISGVFKHFEHKLIPTKNGRFDRHDHMVPERLRNQNEGSQTA